MVDDLKALRARLDSLKLQRAKDEGAREQTMTRLANEFDCKTLAAARTKYAKMKADCDKAGATLDATVENIEAEVTAMEQAVAGR